ncbi:Krueppel-like factor 2 [Contarinia nasturtii]|uniref:Krueppel-like factor 2 n=1 Tax=Contarinia nasturtii TaxID=265458 RepID=UPI0012D3F1CA|nr:Krueppel-like factor 2 [Contarinia nasturtii]
MDSNLDPGEGTSDGRVKRKPKPKPSIPKITIKKEVDIKVEPEDEDGTAMVQYSPPPSAVEASAIIKSESESGEELWVKKELREAIRMRNMCEGFYTEKHLRTHVKQLPFDCSKCGQRFADENAKQSHEDHCKRRRFSQKDHANLHMKRVHH